MGNPDILDMPFTLLHWKFRTREVHSLKLGACIFRDSTTHSLSRSCIFVHPGRYNYD
jgi:hypothetical protein